MNIPQPFWVLVTGLVLALPMPEWVKVGFFILMIILIFIIHA